MGSGISKVAISSNDNIAALVTKADQAGDDLARGDIAVAISRIISNNPAAADKFATDKAAAALIKIKNETVDGNIKATITGIIDEITKNNLDPKINIPFADPTVKPRLTKLYNAAQKSQEGSFPYIQKLLFRYLTNNVSDRGDLKYLLAMANPLIDTLIENPQHLTWTDNLASQFLAACVNQPQAGLSEIYAMMAIAQANNITEKLTAAKHLILIEEVKKYIVTLPQDQKIASGIEIEAGNALIRDVHAKLLTEKIITKPFYGISAHIAYEASLLGWITPEKVDAAYRTVKSAMEEDISVTATRLCEGANREVWIEIAFPEEVAKMKKVHSKQKGFLGHVAEIKGAENKGEKLSEILADLTGEDLDSFKEYYKTRKDEDLTSTNAEWKQLEDMHAREIATMVQKLTIKAIAQRPAAIISEAVAASPGQKLPPAQKH